MNGLQPQPRLPDPARSRVVLIGCSRYSNYDDLPAVTTSVADLEKLLTDPENGSFRSENCRRITDPRNPVELAAAVLEAARSASDTLLVYYAGHGVPDELNKLHLTVGGTSADAAMIPDTALPYERIRSIVRDSTTAKTRVVILDCCYAGLALDDMSDSGLAASSVIKGSYVLSATDADKQARGTNGAGYTAFTGALIRMLRGGITDGPDLLTLDDLFPHLCQALVNDSLPEPHRQGKDFAGFLALGRNPARHSPELENGHHDLSHRPDDPGQQKTTPQEQARRPRVAALAVLGSLILVAGLALVLRPDWGTNLNYPGPTPVRSVVPTTRVTTTGTTISPATSPGGATPTWMPTAPGGAASANAHPLYAVHVTSPKDGQGIPGACLLVQGSSNLPAGKTLLLGSRNLDGNPEPTFFYQPLTGWKNDPAPREWKGQVALGSAVSQRYQIVVLVADVAELQKLDKSGDPWASTTSVPDLQLVTLLTVKQTARDHPC